MKLKANLHFHTAEDPKHQLTYTIKDGIDHAVSLGFNVLAVTCHRSYVCDIDDIEYAASKGIMLIPGIESDIYDDHKSRNQSHVIILNSNPNVEKIHTFDELREYKKKYPEIFILAPHPYFYGPFSLHDNLEEHIDLFDAVEHSWFYSQFFNRNKKAAEIAKRHNKPFIATSDTHFFDFFDMNYTIVDAKEKTPEAFFEAIRNYKYENVTTPRKAHTDMFIKFGWFTLKEEICNLLRKYKRTEFDKKL